MTFKKEPIRFVKYKDCDICGVPWPEKELRKQYGWYRCPKCYEELDYDQTRG